MFPIMISRPPTIRIKKNIWRMPSCNMLLLNLILLIDVTFSTPQMGDYANNPVEGDGGGVVNHPCIRSSA